MDERFGPFRLLSRLGRGGMGETFVAERTGLAGFAQRVCLKRVLSSDSSDAEWIRMFQSEARLVAMLHHPNIVSLFDFGHERGTCWMALELVEGVDLRSIHTSVRGRNAHLPFDAIAFVAAELAKALAHAHARALPDGRPAGIVHRDVSPSNVLVSYDGAVKLADFGIAKVTHGERTRTGEIKGKAPYMSPEQSLGDTVDGRSDLFALGVVLFELLAGVRPFDGPTYLATQKNAVEGKRKDLRALAPQTPEPLARIVDRLSESDRDRRFASADELLDALSEMPTPANVVRTLGARERRGRPRWRWASARSRGGRRPGASGSPTKQVASGGASIRLRSRAWRSRYGNLNMSRRTLRRVGLITSCGERPKTMQSPGTS